MILIGQFDSPFVRRVAIAMRLYAMDFEHRPWSVFGDAERLKAINPLMRVPTLVMDDGEVLIESSSILDALDQLAGENIALAPATGPDRRAVLRICALACGLADKGVSLLYEMRVHQRGTPAWSERCRMQIEGAADALEADRAKRKTDWWFSHNISHADIAVAVALYFVCDAHPGLIDLAKWPRLKAHSDRCEALEVFAEIKQPFRLAPLSTKGSAA